MAHNIRNTTGSLIRTDAEGEGRIKDCRFWSKQRIARTNFLLRFRICNNGDMVHFTAGSRNRQHRDDR